MNALQRAEPASLKPPGATMATLPCMVSGTPGMGVVIDSRRVLVCVRHDLHRFAVSTYHPMADFLHRTVLTPAGRGADYAHLTQGELAVQDSPQDG